LGADLRILADLSDRVLRHDPRRMVAETRERMGSLRVRLDRAMERSTREVEAQVQSAEARLHALSPLDVLQRGYAIVLDSNDVLIRSAAQVAEGGVVRTRLRDGSFASRVIGPANTSEASGQL